MKWLSPEWRQAYKLVCINIPITVSAGMALEFALKWGFWHWALQTLSLIVLTIFGGHLVLGAAWIILEGPGLLMSEEGEIKKKKPVTTDDQNSGSIGGELNR